nr:MAG TPA: hypothetical protein [Caudoviricetes sp.]
MTNFRSYVILKHFYKLESNLRIGRDITSLKPTTKLYHAKRNKTTKSEVKR